MKENKLEAIEQDFEMYDDESTPIACMVCGGDWMRVNKKTGSGEYRKAECRWCFRGSMNSQQFKRWKHWSAKRREKNSKMNAA